VASAERAARDWSLVLASAGIDCRLDPVVGGWAVSVRPADAAAADAVLAAYDRENAPSPPVAERGAWDSGPTFAGVLVPLGLLAFHAALAGSGRAGAWTARGGASARALLDGEWWRAVTALTLHADVPHVLTNGVIGAVVLTGVCRAYGVGLGLLLVVLTGAAGNLCNAAAQGPPHMAIGASTGVFAALGLLAGLEAVRRPWRRAWVAPAAAVALLALLGTGKGTDVLAHLFGVAAGGAAGLTVAAALRQPPGRPAQWALTAAAAGLVAGAWALAWR